MTQIEKRRKLHHSILIKYKIHSNDTEMANDEDITHSTYSFPPGIHSHGFDFKCYRKT